MFYIITYATKSTGYLPALQQSAERFNYKLVILGQNEKWNGFMQRIDAYRIFCEKLKSDDVVCCIDAYDCILLRNSDDFLRTFYSFNSDKVIFSTAADDLIQKILFGPVHHDDKKYKYNRLTSGSFVGYASNVAQLLNVFCNKHNCQKTHQNDQQLFTDMYLYLRNKAIILDTNCELFYSIDNYQHWLIKQSKTLFGVSNTFPLETKYYKFDNKKLYLKITDTFPFILHGNGNVNIDLICKHLDLPLKKENDRDYFQYSTKDYLIKVIVLCLLILSIIFIVIIVVNLAKKQINHEAPKK